MGVFMLVKQIADEVSRVVPAEAPSPEQWEISKKAMETIAYENMILAKWKSSINSSVIEFAWARSFNLFDDTNVYYTLINNAVDSFF